MIGPRAAPIVLAWLALATAAVSERIAVTLPVRGPAALPHIVEVRGEGLLVEGRGSVRSYVRQGARLVLRGEAAIRDGRHCLAACDGLVASDLVAWSIDPHPPIVWTRRTETSIEPIKGGGVGGGGQAEVVVADSATSTVIARDDLRGHHTLELRSASGSSVVPVEGAGIQARMSPNADIVAVTTGVGPDILGLPRRVRTRLFVRESGGWRLHGAVRQRTTVFCVGDDGTAIVRDQNGDRLVNLHTDETFADKVRIPYGLQPSDGCGAISGRAVVAYWHRPEGTLWGDAGRYPVQRWTIDVVGGEQQPTQTVDARQVQVDPTLARFAFIDGANDLTVVNLNTGAGRVVAHDVASTGFLASGALAVVHDDGTVAAHLPATLP